MKKYFIENNSVPAIVYCEENPGITENSPDGFTEITDEAVVQQLTEKRYSAYEKSGISFYNSVRSKLSRQIDIEEITALQAFLVETHLKNVSDNLRAGNWLTAQYHCHYLELEGIFTQELKDEILYGINNYITDNY